MSAPAWHGAALLAALLWLASAAPAGSAAAAGPVAAATASPEVDRIVVRKADRRLELQRAGQVLRSYRISLGLVPTGHKQREGDFRTPEGHYRLGYRNPRSEFFLSIHISYPDADDVRYAKRHGWAPGGSIMIHGWPNTITRDPLYYELTDWTDGCIAVSNSDMVEIWMMTAENTPIDILP